MRRKYGFTLIELLVVIAIIGILAAIIFPVYAQTKKSAYKSSDLSNMNTLRTALQLYKADQGSFPPALLGYVSQYENVSGGNIVPPNQLRAALYPKRVESLTILRPALNRVSENPAPLPFDAAAIQAGSNTMVSAAVWPNGLIDGAAGQPLQRYGPTRQVTHPYYQPGTTNCSVEPSFFYRLSGYDAAEVQDGSARRFETHYQLFWTGWSVPNDPCNPLVNESGSGQDNPRQLGYSEPPDDTVVTWNSFFRDYQNGQPIRQKQDLVLFLAGNARPMDSVNVATQAWAVRP